MLRFACPHCQKGLRAYPRASGQLLRCPDCKKAFQVPQEEDQPGLASVLPPIPKLASVSPLVAEVVDGGDVLESEALPQEPRSKTGLVVVSLLIPVVLCGALVLVVFIKQHDAELERAGHQARRAPEPAKVDQSTRKDPERETGEPPVRTRPQEAVEAPHRPPIELPDVLRKKPSPPNRAEEEEGPGTAPSETPSAEISKHKGAPAVPEVDAVEVPRVGKPTPAPVAPVAPPTKKTQELIEKSIKTIKSGKPAERLHAFKVLTDLGPNAKGASRALCEALLDTSPKIRLAAAEALEKANAPLHALVIPILVDKDLSQRTEAIENLKKLGAEGKPALPVLIYFRQQFGGGSAVIEAMAGIASDDKALTAFFASWLTKDVDATARVAIAEAIGHMEGAKQQINTLATVLKTDTSDEVRLAVAKTLGAMGPDARAAASALKIAKTDASAPVREAANQALVRIEMEK